MNTSPGIIIQARTGSTRLPDKVLRPFHKNMSILEILIERFRIYNDYRLVVATTEADDDIRICELSDRMGVPFFRGPSENVLERFFQASTSFSIDPVIRICSDNPFLLQSSPAELLERFKEKNADYIGYRLSGGRKGIKTHFGLWAELISREAMQRVLEKDVDRGYLEHVTNYLYEREDEFSISYIEAPDIVYSRDDIRLTVDSEADFVLAREIYRKFHTNYKVLDLENLIETVDANPDWKNEMKKSIAANDK